MPVLDSDYKPPWYLRNRHVQTMYPSLFRKVEGVRYTRHRLDTADDDFIHLDVSLAGDRPARHAVMVVHGLGGHSRRAYIRGMIKAFNDVGRDGFAFNFRSCGGEMNRQLKFYHSGDTADLHTAIKYIISTYGYESIGLTGFSMGGNVIVKYLGEQGENLAAAVRAATVFSVPCDLDASCIQLDRPKNVIYLKRFLRMLHRAIKAKMELFPEQLNDDAFTSIRKLRDYDNYYTAPLHGFENAGDYYRKSSCLSFIPRVTIPTLMVNAKNDPFLAPSCFPLELAREHSRFFLETPKSGGHVGFIEFNDREQYWHEKRAIRFILDHSDQS